MIHYADNYFQKIDNSTQSTNDFLAGTRRDLKIAADSDVSEVKFRFSYDALIKLGLALIAHEGYRIRSSVGHRIKIIEKISQLLHDSRVEYLGNRMRQVRNDDLYSGGVMISQKDSEAYLKFVRSVVGQGVKLIKDKNVSQTK